MLKDLESYSFLSSSISIIFCMPVVGFAMLIFMLGEGKQRKPACLAVASSDLRIQRTRATSPGHHARDDNHTLNLGLCKISFMRRHGLVRGKLISSSSHFFQLLPEMFMIYSCAAGTCTSPTFCASKRLRDPRRQAMAR